MQLGNSTNTTLRSRMGTITQSDERDKADISPLKKALDFIRKINPISFVLNHRAMYEPEIIEEEGIELSDETRALKEASDEQKRTFGLGHYDKEAHARGDKKGDRRRVGVSAQQTQQALEEVYGTADYADIISDNLHDYAQENEIPEGVESQLSANYQAFIPFLIDSVKALAAQNEELKARIEAIELSAEL